MTFEELLAAALEHAGFAEHLVDDAFMEASPLAPEVLREKAAIHASLAETYARLASAVIVNRTSLHHAVIAEGSGGPRPS
jgi:hypothetical protein